MRKLLFQLSALAILFLLFNCEQESTVEPLKDTTKTEIFLTNATIESSDSITPASIEKYIIENENGEIESRSGRTKIGEFHVSVRYGFWKNFYFEKHHLDQSCKYYAVVTPSHGDTELYVYGKDDNDYWRKIRRSTEEGHVEEAYGTYHDLQQQETRLYFSVYGNSDANFKIEFFKECSDGGNCVCTHEYNPIVGCDGKQYNNPCEARCAGQYCPDNGEGPSIHFVKPENHSNFDIGKYLYVRVNANDHDGVKQVALYVNGHFVRKELHAPYEWGKPHATNDHKLNNMQAGTYKIRAVATDHHNNKSVKEITITIGENNNGCNCPSVYDPVTGCDGKEYNNACEAKCAGEYCSDIGHGPSLHFVTPSNHHTFNRGKNLYVKVNASDHDGVKFVKLYVNNHFVRKESNAPYEWGMPHAQNDYQLNNLQPGTYKIKAVAVDHHGDQSVRHITVTVRH